MLRRNRGVLDSPVLSSIDLVKRNRHDIVQIACGRWRSCDRPGSWLDRSTRSGRSQSLELRGARCRSINLAQFTPPTGRRSSEIEDFRSERETGRCPWITRGRRTRAPASGRGFPTGGEAIAGPTATVHLRNPTWVFRGATAYCKAQPVLHNPHVGFASPPTAYCKVQPVPSQSHVGVPRLPTAYCTTQPDFVHHAIVPLAVIAVT